MATIWPPQDTGVFEFKMPCCQCQSPQTLWAWGDNTFGQLGFGTTGGAHLSPLQVGVDVDWDFVTTVNMSSGEIPSTLAIKTDGTLWAWGDNGFGQLGLGLYGGAYTSPNQVGSFTDWISVSTICFLSDGGNSFGCTVAVRGNGTLWGSGNVTDTLSYNVFTQIGSATNWAMASVGMYFFNNGPAILAIKTDGTLWAMGENAAGQLGFGTTGGVHSSMAQVGSATNWKYVTTGGGYTWAIKTDGTIWSWGSGTTSPTQIGSDSDWANVSIGDSETLAIKSSGTLWKSSAAGGSAVFSQVGSDTDWESASCGATYHLAIKTDGTLWAWGGNIYGELGFGTTGGSHPSPAQVGADSNWIQTAAGNRSSFSIKG